MQIKLYRVKITRPDGHFYWVSQRATSESMAKALALGEYAGRLGLVVSECVEAKEAA